MCWSSVSKDTTSLDLLLLSVEVHWWDGDKEKPPLFSAVLSCQGQAAHKHHTSGRLPQLVSTLQKDQWQVTKRAVMAGTREQKPVDSLVGNCLSYYQLIEGLSCTSNVLPHTIGQMRWWSCSSAGKTWLLRGTKRKRQNSARSCWHCWYTRP